ncbi:MAG: Ribonuclease [Verrucomicrobiales bacterium]|nr:Ribonuclease [Verrucomicrobiales bacterium]
MPGEPVSRIRKIQEQAQAILQERHVVQQDKASRLHKFIHFWIFLARNFSSNRCPVRASALAYTSILALVPVLAVVISISTSLLKTKDGEKRIETAIDTLVSKMAPQLGLISQNTDGTTVNPRKEVVAKIKGFVDSVNGGTLSTMASLALMFIAISLLVNIENTMNDIWGVTHGRTWGARVVQYTATLVLGSIGIFAALALNAGPYLPATKALLDSLPFVGHLLYSFLPVVLLMVGFAVFYRLMPNTKVEWSAAFVGGALGGGLWHLTNLLNVLFVKQVANNMSIYGSLGVIPILLVGIYFSWLILLFGAQTAYAFQNRRVYLQEKEAQSVSQRGQEFIALRVMTFIAQEFYKGECPPTSTRIAESIGVSSRLIGRVIQPLLEKHLVIEASSSRETDGVAFAPGRPLDKISYQNILDAMRTGIGQELATKEEPARELVQKQFEKIRDAERAAGDEVTLEALVKATTGSSFETKAVAS